MDAYESLHAVWRQVEGIDVKEGEYAFIAADGRGVEASVSEKWDVTLRVVDVDRSAELRQRLVTGLPRIGLDARLADSPLEAAQALVDERWARRWPRHPAWLDRRLHGERPVLTDG
jgi:hypothetical protein